MRLSDFNAIKGGLDIDWTQTAYIGDGDSNLSEITSVAWGGGKIYVHSGEGEGEGLSWGRVLQEFAGVLGDPEIILTRGDDAAGAEYFSLFEDGPHQQSNQLSLDTAHAEDGGPVWN